MCGLSRIEAAPRREQSALAPPRLTQDDSTGCLLSTRGRYSICFSPCAPHCLRARPLSLHTHTHGTAPVTTRPLSTHTAPGRPCCVRDPVLPPSRYEFATPRAHTLPPPFVSPLHIVTPSLPVISMRRLTPISHGPLSLQSVVVIWTCRSRAVWPSPAAREAQSW